MVADMDPRLRDIAAHTVSQIKKGGFDYYYDEKYPSHDIYIHTGGVVLLDPQNQHWIARFASFHQHSPGEKDPYRNSWSLSVVCEPFAVKLRGRGYINMNDIWREFQEGAVWFQKQLAVEDEIIQCRDLLIRAEVSVHKTREQLESVQDTIAYLAQAEKNVCITLGPHLRAYFRSMI